MKVLAGGVIFILSLLQSCFHFPDAFAGQFDGVSRVCDAVENGVSDSRVPDGVIPVSYRQL